MRWESVIWGVYSLLVDARALKGVRTYLGIPADAGLGTDLERTMLAWSRCFGIAAGYGWYQRQSLVLVLNTRVESCFRVPRNGRDQFRPAPQ